MSPIIKGRQQTNDQVWVEKYAPLYKEEKFPKYREPHLGKNIHRPSCHSNYDEYTEGQVGRDHNWFEATTSLRLELVRNHIQIKKFQIRVD